MPEPEKDERRSPKASDETALAVGGAGVDGLLALDGARAFRRSKVDAGVPALERLGCDEVVTGAGADQLKSSRSSMLPE